ncbi:MAG TPA: hypothetical protein VLJ15_02985, partial [Gammaproteobacteria bacterium]|nr:hypothetical protein [Gammaproteobacteria bacterium]
MLKSNNPKKWDDWYDPNEPVSKRKCSPDELAEIHKNAQQTFRDLQGSPLALPHSTGIINDKLGIAPEPAPEIKYDESEVKKKLVAAIARQYEEKLTADQ